MVKGSKEPKQIGAGAKSLNNVKVQEHKHAVLTKSLVGE